MNEKKKNKFSFSSLIYNDRYLIILSIFLAIVVWIATSLSVGTDETKTIKVDVPIKLGDQISEQLGMQYYSLHDTVELSVTIAGPKYVIGQVTQDDLKVKFDTTAVNRTGNQSIPIQVTNKSKRLDYNVQSVYPSSIEGYFDVNTSKTFDVKVRYDSNAIAEGYIFGDPVISDEKIVISGPKSQVDKITSTYCQIDYNEIENITEPFNKECDIHFEGIGIDTSYLTITNREDINTPLSSISVTLPVMKELDLPVSATFEDQPANLDSNVVRVSYSAKNVRAGVLSTANISSANIGTIYFSDLSTGTQRFDFATNEINGVKVLDGTENITATVTVSSTYSQHNVRVSKNMIKIDGAPAGTTPSVASLDDVTVTVIAPKTAVITAKDLTLKCDVSEENEDNFYPISITVNNNKAWVYGKYHATINM